MKYRSPLGRLGFAWVGIFLWIALALTALGAACGSDDDDDPPANDDDIDVGNDDDDGGDDDDDPSDCGWEGGAFEPWPEDALRLNHIQMRGTHNSYHLASDGSLPDWQYEHAPLEIQFGLQGVRQIELDVHWEELSQSFGLYHVRDLDNNSNCGNTIAGCLEIMKRWSDDHPAHHPIFVYIEPKEEFNDDPIAGHWDAFDAEVRGVLPPEKLVTPDDVQRGHDTMKEALANDGWPPIDAMRGRFLFMLLGPDRHVEEYSWGHECLRGRVMFVNEPNDHPLASVRIINSALGDADRILEAVNAGLMVRTMAGNQEKFDKALEIGAHLISNDYPAPDMSEDGFWSDIPGGTPSRCNPITAPDDCTPEAIENLR